MKKILIFLFLILLFYIVKKILSYVISALSRSNLSHSKENEKLNYLQKFLLSKENEDWGGRWS